MKEKESNVEESEIERKFNPLLIRYSSVSPHSKGQKFNQTDKT